MQPTERSIREIDHILEGVRTHFMYSDELMDRLNIALNYDALHHSNKLEPDIDHAVTLKKLHEAWEFATEYFERPLDSGFICEIGNKIDGRIWGYRTSSARVYGITGELSVLTNPAKIDREMDKLIARINSEDHHPVYKAVELGLYFKLIHPFTDGNGRTARLLQNLFLYKNGLPPIVNQYTQRVTYMRHVEDAQKGFKARDISDEKMFELKSFGEVRYMEYMLDRIKHSSEKLAAKVSRHHRYCIHVDLNGSSKRIYGVRELIRARLEAFDEPYQIKCSPTRGELLVVTSATEECLIGTLEKARRRQKSNVIKRYDIQKMDQVQ